MSSRVQKIDSTRCRIGASRGLGLAPFCGLAGDERVEDGGVVLELSSGVALACKASGTPTWSPHDLRHLRISLWHRQGA